MTIWYFEIHKVTVYTKANRRDYARKSIAHLSR
jgi:hypothetical protein